jgi:hypothetical protein
MHTEQLEELAGKILGRLGLKAPVNALVVADALGLRLVPVGPYDEGRTGDEIRFNAAAPYRERQEYLASAIGRWLLMREGFYGSELAARRLGRALMLPRAQLLKDLETERDLESLQRRHVHASSTMIAARLSDLGVSVRAIRPASSSSANRSATASEPPAAPASTVAHLPPLAGDSPQPQSH